MRAADPQLPDPLDPWGPRLIDTASRLVFPSMGTVISLDVPAGLDAHRRDELQEIFVDHDARFSRFRTGSEATAVSTGCVDVSATSESFRSAFRIAQEWYMRTDGAFTPYPPTGGLDLDGVVKALAMRAAGGFLDRCGMPTWCLDAGGDVLVRSSPSGPGWVIGIVDPREHGGLLARVRLDGHHLRALATSGTAERGEHIWRVPGAEEVIQASVLSADIVAADVLATAVVAGGRATMRHVVAEESARGCPVEALRVVGARGELGLAGTPGFAGLTACASPGHRAVIPE